MKTLIFNEPDKLWFVSDTHFHHENIIKYCNRPFNDVGHMDKTMIENWCSVVKSDDTVFHLGDFCWGDTKMWMHYLSQLTGSIILIRGNHDKDGTCPNNRFLSVYEILNIIVKDTDAPEGNQRLTLCHYPMLSWYQSHRGAWQLFGHWHNRTITIPEDKNSILPDYLEVKKYVKEEHLYMDRTRATQYDCGVDGSNYFPLSYHEIKKIINGQIKSRN